MPRATLEPIDSLLADAAEAGVTLPDADERARYGLASSVSFLLRHGKRVEAPRADHVLASDELATVEIPVRALGSAADLPALLSALGDEARRSRARTVPWLDATRSADPEFRFEHALYGEVTMFAWPSRPRPTADEAVRAAERAGWAQTLKAHNLLPGRGLVVERPEAGLWRAPGADALAGALLQTASGEVSWYVNPYVEARFADPEFQFWLAWGEGMAPSAWRTKLTHDPG